MYLPYLQNVFVQMAKYEHEVNECGGDEMQVATGETHSLAIFNLCAHEP